MENQRGFTLIELMIGMVIGLLATLVIMQVFSVFEGQKRSTTGTADAQVNGNIALYNVQRELQFAGYGLPIFDKNNTAFNCPTTTVVNIGTSTTPINLPLFPITITDTGGVDSISVRYGATLGGGIPVRVKLLSGNDIDVPNSLGCAVNDAILLNAANKCNVTKVTAITNYASADDKIRLASATGVALGDKVSCLGNWTEAAFRVNANQLERNNTPIVAEIVDMQAQYGISSSASSNQVTAWVNATAATGWAAPSVANRNRIKAVRIAIVARNGTLEQTAVTTACSSLTAATPTGLCAWEGTVASPAPALFANRASPPANWQNYRYRVFETIIPLRNMLWAKN